MYVFDEVAGVSDFSANSRKVTSPRRGHAAAARGRCSNEKVAHGPNRRRQGTPVAARKQPSQGGEGRKDQPW